MATTIERPGVQVIQEFRTVSPTILIPAMPACVVGPCNQVIEAVDDSGVLVADAMLNLPARIAFSAVTTPFQYNVAVVGDDLVISVNGAAPVTVVIDDPGGGVGPTTTQLAAQINSEVPGVVALVESYGSSQRVVVYTVSTGDNAKLEITPATEADPLDYFGIAENGTNYALLGNGYRYFGHSGYTNYTKLSPQLADYPDPRDNIDDLVIDYDTVRVFVANGSGSFREVLRTETFLQGATAAVTVIDDGDGDNLSPILDFASANFTAGPSNATAVGDINIAVVDVSAMVLRMSLDGDDFQTLTFPASTNTSAETLQHINAMWQKPGGAAIASLSGNFLQLDSDHPNGGRESSIRIDLTASASACTALGLSGTGPFGPNDVVYGNPFNPAVGDEVWVDGVNIGEIIEVVAGVTDRLRISAEQLLTYTGDTYTIVAKGLDNEASTATRPSSDLIVDVDSGTVTVKQGLFRDTAGAESLAGPLPTYLGYTALRTDVSPTSESFELLRYGSTTDLATDLSPIDTQNPLGLGMYFALLNAPGIEITGCGVGETSDTEPEGSLDGYVAAFEYLESKDVYGIAPLTHADTVGQIAQVHVDAMSLPENGLERFVAFNPSRPTRESSVLVASGATGNVSGAPTDTVQTGIANLQALLAAAGVPGPTFVEADMVYLDFEDDTNHYLLESVSGGAVVINDGILTSNDDGFFYDAAAGNVFADAVVDRPFSIYIRGDALANRTDEATAYADIARSYLDRRMVVTAPDKARATIDGLETLIEGYYLNAALVGLVSAKAPQQPLTEESLAGFTGVSGSTDRYSELQLKMMCGGGLWVFYQPSAGAAVRTRHQLTSDMSSVEKREFSIMNALDFAAKFFRSGLRNFIGRFNITTTVQDAVNLTLDGMAKFLVRQGVFASITIDAIRQSTSSPDEVEIDMTVTVLYPLNRISITLVV